MQLKKIAAATMLAALGITGAQAAPTTADVIVMMDESGSMSGEQAWIGGAITQLDSELNTAGLTGNQYGSVGFSVGGGQGLTRFFNMTGGGTSNTYAGLTAPWGAAAAVGTLAYSIGGGTEDGWAAIAAANQYSFRSGSARNYILVTDEDRDAANNTLTYAGTLASLTSTNTLLNAIVNANYTCDVNGQTVRTGVIGIGGGGACFVADGAGGYTLGTNGTAFNGAGNTIADYVNLALASGGAAWDLNILRAGGLNAQSFTEAFVDIKVQEIQNQTPEPGTLALAGLAMTGLFGLRRRKSV